MEGPRAWTQCGEQGPGSSQGTPPSHTTWSLQGSPVGASAPRCLEAMRWLSRTGEVASPLFSPAPRTSSATRRTELSRAGRSALGTSQRTKYSSWGPPARGLRAGRVSRCWIWASKAWGREGKGGRDGEGEARGRGREPLGSAHPAAPRLPQPETQARPAGRGSWLEPGFRLICVMWHSGPLDPVFRGGGGWGASVWPSATSEGRQAEGPTVPGGLVRAHRPHPGLRGALEPAVARSGGSDPLSEDEGPGLAGRCLHPGSRRPAAG